MFAVVEVSTYTTMAPEYLGPDLVSNIQQRIYVQYQGQYHHLYGFIIAILKIMKIDLGYVLERGQVLFKVVFQAVVFKPVQDEVLDAIVTDVNPSKIYADVGPMKCLIPKTLLPSNMEYSSQERAYIDKNSEDKIAENSTIRLRITLITEPENSLQVCGTIADDYLGLVKLARE